MTGMEDLLFWDWYPINFDRFIGIAAIIIAFGTVVINIFLHYEKRNYESLKDQKTHSEFISRLESPERFPRYLIWLQNCLNKVNSYFGPQKISWRALGGCVPICMSYSLLFFLMSWMFDGDVSLTQSPFLPETDIICLSDNLCLNRVVYVVCCVFIWFTVKDYAKTYANYLTIKNISKFGMREKISTTTHAATAVFLFVFAATTVLFPAKSSIFNNFILACAGAALVVTVGTLTAFISVIVRPIAVRLIGKGTLFACLGVLTTIIATVMSISVATAVASFGVTADSIGAVFLILIAGGTGVVFALGNSDAGSHNAIGVTVGGASVALAITLFDILAFKVGAAVLLLFLFILPFFNALFDWGTWAASRFFGEELLARKNQECRWALFYSFIDLLAAILLFAGLVATLSFVVSIFNVAISELQGPEYAFTINETINRTAEDPWGASGIWITLMLLSTFFPTFFHITGAFQAARYYGLTNTSHKLADILRKDTIEEFETRKVSRFFSGLGTVAVFMTIGLGFLFFGVIAAFGVHIPKLTQYVAKLVLL